jgi:hypothetical protein
MVWPANAVGNCKSPLVLKFTYEVTAYENKSLGSSVVAAFGFVLISKYFLQDGSARTNVKALKITKNFFFMSSKIKA